MKHVLLSIEDHDFRDSIADLLKFEGYRVFEARQCDQTQEILKCWRIDIIVCDVRIMHSQLYQTIRNIRTDSATAGIPFFMLTSTYIYQDIGEKLGISEYLIKPASIENIKQYLDRYLQHTETTCH